MLSLFYSDYECSFFTIILQQIEGNILAPKILGSTTGISEFWVTFALLFFGGIFGFVGMIVGVPLFAVIYYLVRMWLNEHLKSKGLPVVSEEYRDVERYDIANGGFIMLPHNYQAERRQAKRNQTRGIRFWRRGKKKDDDSE